MEDPAPRWATSLAWSGKVRATPLSRRGPLAWPRPCFFRLPIHGLWPRCEERDIANGEASVANGEASGLPVQGATAAPLSEPTRVCPCISLRVCAGRTRRSAGGRHAHN